MGLCQSYAGYHPTAGIAFQKQRSLGCIMSFHLLEHEETAHMNVQKMTDLPLEGQRVLIR